jgi:hypothetical protein
MTSPALCSSCGQSCRLTDGREIYPPALNLADKAYYVCDPCGSRVGCHPGTVRPLGTAADGYTRGARILVHALLDPIWKGNDDISRSETYACLADAMGLALVECHIGLFTEEQCLRAADILADGFEDGVRAFRRSEPC